MAKFLRSLSEQEKNNWKRKITVDDVVEKVKEKEAQEKEKRRRLFNQWLHHQNGWHHLLRHHGLQITALRGR